MYSLPQEEKEERLGGFNPLQRSAKPEGAAEGWPLLGELGRWGQILPLSGPSLIDMIAALVWSFDLEFVPCSWISSVRQRFGIQFKFPPNLLPLAYVEYTWRFIDIILSIPCIY